MPTKQARNCRVGDIILFKNKESRIITDINHRTEGVVRVTFIRPDGTGGTYFEYYDRYGLPETFRCGPFDRVLKVVDQGGLF